SASIMMSSSMMWWSEGVEVGWMTNTSVPRTCSSILIRVSPFLKPPTSAFPSDTPSRSQISMARGRLALPAKTFRSSIRLTLSPLDEPRANNPLPLSPRPWFLSLHDTGFLRLDPSDADPILGSRGPDLCLGLTHISYQVATNIRSPTDGRFRLPDIE